MNKEVLSTYKKVLIEKEIPREVEAPNLSLKEIRNITDIVFVNQNLNKADIIFVFGSSEGDWQDVAKLFHQKLAPIILVSGLTGKKYYEKGKPLAHFIRDELISFDVPEKAILTQDSSTNTLEDVRFGKTLLERRNIFPKSILFVSKSHHSGRALLTLKKIFPDTHIYSFSYDAIYDGVQVNSNNWWKHPVTKSRVYGEYIRIQTYSERGDISTPS